MLEDFACFSGRRNGENWATERENGVERRRQGLRRSPHEPTPAPVNTRQQAKKYQPENWLVFLIGGGKRNRTRVRFPKRIAIEPASVRVFGLLSFFPRERYLLKGDADWVGERGSSSRVEPEFDSAFRNRTGVHIESPTCCRRIAFDQFRRLVLIAIDHHWHSTNTGQCAIGTGGQYSFGRNNSGDTI